MLTSRQHSLLSFIADRIDVTGCAPSFDEMARAMNLRSKSGIHRLVSALEDRGFVTRKQNLARSIEVVRDVPGRHARSMTGRSGATTVSAAGPESRVFLPLYGAIAAGTPLEAVCEATERVEVPHGMVGAGEHYALRVAGQSMTGDGIMDGDIAVVRRSVESVDGRIAVVLIEDADAALKRLRFNGEVAVLHSSNPSFPPRVLPASAVKVQGVLVGILRLY